jgi:putative intracellular protease/amidase
MPASRTVLCPLPDEGYDPTEAAVPWRMLTARGHRVIFATPSGRAPRPDARMLTGDGLSVWKGVLRADANGRAAHQALEGAREYRDPLAYADLDGAPASRWDALLLPGGHDKPMRTYLESPVLHALVPRFFADRRPVGAICHGVVVAARSRDPQTGNSVLFGRRTTSLTRSQEMLAWNMTRLWLGDYYRTYAISVEDEVRSALARSDHYVTGPMAVLRDSPENPGRGFVVRDGHYLSARWPGDAHRFAAEFIALLDEPRPDGAT